MRLSEKIPFISLHTASSLHEVKNFYSESTQIIQTQMLLLLELLLELLLLLLLHVFVTEFKGEASRPRRST